LYEVYSLRLWVNDFLQGPPLAGKYDMGALCMHEHSEKLEALLNDALDKGAEIVARGSFGHIGEDAVDQYFPPTVIVNVNHSMRLMQEEVAKLAIFSVFTLPLFSFFIILV
jgi:acyl-CoA reductase-like NAD-dependent aldehyde dehydrogenase